MAIKSIWQAHTPISEEINLKLLVTEALYSCRYLPRMNTQPRLEFQLPGSVKQNDNLILLPVVIFG